MQVIMYHFINSKSDDKVFKKMKGVDVELFEEQIKSLLQKYYIIGFEELEEIIKNKTDHEKYCILTFDDGVKQHYHNVLPILKKYGIVGFFAIPTLPIFEKVIPLVEKERFIQYSGIFSNYIDMLELFYEKSKIVIKSVDVLNKIKPTNENLNQCQSYLEPYDFYSLEERFFRYIRNEILNFNDFSNIINSIFPNELEQYFIDNYFLSIDEVATLSDEGMIICNHTHTHRLLTTLSENDIKKELLVSQRYLKKFDNYKNILMYPFGNNNEVVRNICKEMNFFCCFDTIPQENKHIDKFNIHRYDEKIFFKIKEGAKL